MIKRAVLHHHQDNVLNPRFFCHWEWLGRTRQRNAEADAGGGGACRFEKGAPGKAESMRAFFFLCANGIIFSGFVHNEWYASRSLGRTVWIAPNCFACRRIGE